MQKREALDYKRRIESLISASRAQVAIDADTSAWLGKLDDDMNAKLARVGLCKTRVSDEPALIETLEPWIERYIASRTDVKDSTATVFKRT